MKAYRYSVIALFFIEILYSFSSWGWSYFGAQDSLYWVGYGAIMSRDLSVVATHIVAAVYLISYIGLFFLQNWARYLLLVISVVSVLLAPFYGVSVSSGVESMIGYCLAISSGAILAMSFFSKVSCYFHGNSE